ncbi:MAG: dihydrodipicolinate synthase family protein [Acidobacteriota bacterium]
MKLSGVFVAPVTPLDSGGRLDLAAFELLLDFLLEQGIDGLCIGGATSEYPHFDLQERKELISRAVRKSEGKAIVLAAVGASCLERVRELGRHAAREGCAAILLPMPHFFRYEQEDLEAFCREVCSSVSLPCLLYNLPDFTNPLHLTTSMRLLRQIPNLVGIKDSSGRLEALPKLTEIAHEKEVTLLIGSDDLLFQALTAGWDGVISGSANLCPELVVREYQSFRAGDLESAQYCQQLLDALGDQFRHLPVPWGIRAGLEVRGFSTGHLALPLSPSRRKQIETFQSWFANWLERHLPYIVEVQKN